MAIQKAGRLLFFAFSFVLLNSQALLADEDGDLELARSALGILGVDFPNGVSRRSCDQCHDINIFTVRDWINRSGNLMRICFFGGERLPLSVADAEAKINCMRKDRNDPNSEFDVKKMGFQTAFAHTDFYAEFFKQAYPTDWEQKFADFKDQVGMPKNRDPLSAEEVATVKRWVEKGGPYLEKLLANPQPAPTSCTPFVSDALRNHLEDMRRFGWETKNRGERMRMFACAPGEEKAQCFSQKDEQGNPRFPESRTTDMGRDWTADYPEGTIRILRTLTSSTRYWMRSSPDGRFVGNGGSYITDLQTVLSGAPNRDIRITAQYDPEFFPDNSGFMFQDTGPLRDQSGFCVKDILTDETVTKIDFTDARCSTISGGEVGLYQSVGTDLGTGDYLAVFGEFTSNSGSSTEISEEPNWFDSSYLEMVSLVHDGTKYEPQQRIMKWTPYEGDWNLSPSTRMLVSRVAGVQNGSRVHLGYNVHLAKPFEREGRIDYRVDKVGTFCQRGGKGRSSFSERMYAFFHYVTVEDYKEMGFASPTDPAFRSLLGTSNIYVHDLLTGTTKRVTRMRPGQQALFPHYRSDGWLLFQVWDRQLNKRFIVASDASILLEGKLPL